MTPPISSEVLTATEAAAYLQVPVETLRMWRYRGKGPAYAKVGRHVRYRRTVIDHWLEEQERAQRDTHPGTPDG